MIGIKPTISLWNKNVGIYKENTFHLDSEDPLERVLNYVRTVQEIIQVCTHFMIQKF